MELLRRFRGEPDISSDARPRRAVAVLLDAVANIRQERQRQAEAARAAGRIRTSASSSPRSATSCCPCRRMTVVHTGHSETTTIGDEARIWRNGSSGATRHHHPTVHGSESNGSLDSPR